MTHKNEIKRWADSPDNTKVWFKGEPNDDWYLVENPNWFSSGFYIVDDIHAEIRKELADKNKPQVEEI